MLSAVEHRKRIVLGWSEHVLQEHVVRLAKYWGWMAFHPYDSRRSEPGYPDLHLVHPVWGRSLFRELKTTKGKTTLAQDRWLHGLGGAGLDASVWRPADWLDGTIEAELERRHA